MPTVTRKRPAAKPATKTASNIATARAVAKSQKATTPKAAVRAATKRAAATPVATKTKTAARGRKTAPAVEASSNGNGGYTRHEYKSMNAKVMPSIAKRLRSGEPWIDVSSEYGFQLKVRKALAQAGYDTKGAKITIDPINGSGAALAKRVAKRREANDPWYEIEIATGKTEKDLRALLTDHGFEHLAKGRVKRDGTIIGNVNGKTPATVSKAVAARNKQTAKSANAKTAAKPRQERGRAAEVAKAEPTPKRTRAHAPAKRSTSPAAAVVTPPKATSKAKPVKRGPRRVARAKAGVSNPSSVV